MDKFKKFLAFMKRAALRNKADLTALIVTILLTVGMVFDISPEEGIIIYAAYILGVMYRLQKKDDFINNTRDGEFL